MFTTIPEQTHSVIHELSIETNREHISLEKINKIKIFSVTSTFKFGFDESSDPIEIVSPQGKTVTVSPGVDLNLTCHSAFPVNWELDTGNDYFIMKVVQC